MTEIDRLKRAINDSSELSKAGDNKRALKLLDDSIAEAIRDKRDKWVCTLSRHAAVISDYMGDLHLAKGYYERALQHDPDNSITLCSLADLLRRLGEIGLAKQCAAKSYQLSTQRGNELDRTVIDLLLKTWPELGS
jgi:Tfp pilus assembly protein PilF